MFVNISKNVEKWVLFSWLVNSLSRNTQVLSAHSSVAFLNILEERLLAEFEDVGYLSVTLLQLNRTPPLTLLLSLLFLSSQILLSSANLSSPTLHLKSPLQLTNKWPLLHTDSVEYTPSFNPIALKDSALSTHKPIEVRGPGGKATIVHAQYNTPISMYSQDAIMDAIAGQSQAKGHDRWGHTRKLTPPPVCYVIFPLIHLTSHHTDQVSLLVEKLKGWFTQSTTQHFSHLPLFASTSGVNIMSKAVMNMMVVKQRRWRSQLWLQSWML